jgi:hypothetical protein
VLVVKQFAASAGARQFAGRGCLCQTTAWSVSCQWGRIMSGQGSDFLSNRSDTTTTILKECEVRLANGDLDFERLKSEEVVYGVSI